MKTKKRELWFMAILVALLAMACGGLIWISCIERDIVSIVIFSVFECAILIIGVSCIIRANLPSELVMSEDEIPWPPELLNKLFEGREVNVVKHYNAIVASMGGEGYSVDPQGISKIGIQLRVYGYNRTVSSKQHIGLTIEDIACAMSLNVVRNRPGTIFYKEGSAIITIEEIRIPKWTIGEMFRFYVHKTIPSGRLRWDIMAEIALGFLEDE